jgi:hypothetical protein
VGLAGDLEDPARHRDGDPVTGKLTDERVHHFGGRFVWDRSAAAPERESRLKRIHRQNSRFATACSVAQQEGIYI